MHGCWQWVERDMRARRRLLLMFDVGSGWSETCELGEGWLEQNNAADKAHFPFYNLLCNDGAPLLPG